MQDARNEVSYRLITATLMFYALANAVAMALPPHPTVLAQATGTAYSAAAALITNVEEQAPTF